MPNWCFNRLRVYAHDGEESEKQLKKFIKENVNIDKDNALSFQGSAPRPKDLDITAGSRTEEEEAQAKINRKKYGYEDWYEWSINEWGTKWDACSSYVDDEDDNEICITFETAWSPPLEWMQKASAKYPLLTFENNVEEESDAFIGKPIAKAGNVCENITDIRYPQEVGENKH